MKPGHLNIRFSWTGKYEPRWDAMSGRSMWPVAGLVMSYSAFFVLIGPLQGLFGLGDTLTCQAPIITSHWHGSILTL